MGSPSCRAFLSLPTATSWPYSEMLTPNHPALGTGRGSLKGTMGHPGAKRLWD